MQPLNRYLKLLVGLAFLAGSPLLVAQNCGSPSVRIMTWNIRYDNPDDGVHAWPKRKEELLAFIRAQKTDILCIQEGLSSQVAFLKEGLTGFDKRGVGRDDGKEKGEHSAIYFNTSRFACLASGTFWLSPTPDTPSRGWDAALPRIATWLELHDSLTAKSFFVFNTHFDHMGISARESSAVLLRHKIAAMTEGLPVVLTGDFNSLDTDPPYRTLTSHDGTPPFLTDARNCTALPDSGPVFTFVGFEGKETSSPQRIDYIFAGGAAVQSHSTCIARRAEGYLSDHLPVVAEISF